MLMLMHHRTGTRPLEIGTSCRDVFPSTTGPGTANKASRAGDH